MYDYLPRIIGVSYGCAGECIARASPVQIAGKGGFLQIVIS